MSDFEVVLELLKPENWGYLLGLIALLVLVQWSVKRSAKKNNEELKIDTDELSVPELARVWTKGNIKAGSHKVFVALGSMCLVVGIGLVFVAFDQLLLAIAIMLTSFVIPFTQMRKLRVVNLLTLDEDKYQELKKYYAENREALIAEALNDPEVIQVMTRWPVWIRNFNLRATRFKNFRPVRNQYD